MLKHTINTQPLVSVIMPVFNGERFLTEAINSILNQTYQNIELIVVDDASTDSTWSLLQKYKTKIKAFLLKKNSGATFATNYGYRHSQGEFIAIMDSDDVSHLKRIEKQVNYFLRHPDTIVLGTQAKVINGKGQVIGKKTFPTSHEEIYKAYGSVHPMVHPSVMIRKSMLPDKRNMYRDKYGINADYYNLFRLLSYGKFANLPEYLLFYRVHGNNSSLKKLKQCYWDILMIRLEATLKMSYQLSILSLFAMTIQTITVLLLPEKILQQLYFWVKGFQISQ